MIGLRFRKLSDCCIAIQTCIVLHNYAVMQREYIEYTRNANLDDTIAEDDGYQRPRTDLQVRAAGNTENTSFITTSPAHGKTIINNVIAICCAKQQSNQFYFLLS